MYVAKYTETGQTSLRISCSLNNPPHQLPSLNYWEVKEHSILLVLLIVTAHPYKTKFLKKYAN